MAYCNGLMVVLAPEARPLMAARAASTYSKGDRTLPWLRQDWRFGP